MRPRPPPPSPPCAFVAVRALRCRGPRRALGRRRAALDAAAAALAGAGRATPARAWLVPAFRPTRGRGGPEPLGAAALVARRWAYNTELAALPAAADWPNLKKL